MSSASLLSKVVVLRKPALYFSRRELYEVCIVFKYLRDYENRKKIILKLGCESSQGEILIKGKVSVLGGKVKGNQKDKRKKNWNGGDLGND